MDISSLKKRLTSSVTNLFLSNPENTIILPALLTILTASATKEETPAAITITSTP